MVKDLQDLELTVLVPLVLEHLLDCNAFAGLRDDRFEHHPK